MRSMVRAGALLVLIALVPTGGFAQEPAASTAETQSSAPPSGSAAAGSGSAATATAAGSAAAEPGAPAASASGAERVVVPATGYGWSTPKRRTVRAPPRAHRADSPDARMPGFETLADGSTRLFVELSKPVPYDAKPGRGSITYVLKGAHVGRTNDYNPLVTVHFNTPVTTARLVPHGNDLWFEIELRAAVQPNVSVEAGKGGGCVMRIEFPKGEYLQAPAAAARPSAPSAPSAEPSTR